MAYILNAHPLFFYKASQPCVTLKRVHIPGQCWHVQLERERESRDQQSLQRYPLPACVLDSYPFLDKASQPCPCVTLAHTLLVKVGTDRGGGGEITNKAARLAPSKGQPLSASYWHCLHAWLLPLLEGISSQKCPTLWPFGRIKLVEVVRERNVVCTTSTHSISVWSAVYLSLYIYAATKKKLIRTVLVVFLLGSQIHGTQG